MGAEIPNGAILVARAILNSSLWTMRSDDCKVAITCIALANWKDQRWFDGSQEITIKRGQFVRSREDFANSCGLSLQKTRTAIKHLEKAGFLTRFSTSRYTLYTVPKYDFYQTLANYSDSANPTSNQQLTRSQPAPNPHLTSTQPAPNHKQESKEWEERQEGEEAPQPGTVRGHLWNLFTNAHITGTEAQKRQYFEAWYAQAGAQRLEQILMEPRVVGKDIFVIQRWYFNDMLREAK